jgi:tryptophan-rich sensory protein
MQTDNRRGAVLALVGWLALTFTAAATGVFVATLAAFWRVKRVAGALMVPYALWVGFATALNFAIWRLNAG